MLFTDRRTISRSQRYRQIIRGILENQLFALRYGLNPGWFLQALGSGLLDEHARSEGCAGAGNAATDVVVFGRGQ